MKRKTSRLSDWDFQRTTSSVDSPTVRNFVARWLPTITEGRKRPEGYVTDTNKICKHLGHLRLMEVEREHALKLKRLYEHTPSACNHMLWMGRRMFRSAINDRLAVFNPFEGVPSCKIVSVRRSVRPREAKKIVTAAYELAKMGKIPRGHGKMIHLLFITGARISELCRLRWSEVHLEDDEEPHIEKVEHKTDRLGVPLRIYLTGQARQLIESQRGEHDVWVFPTRHCNSAIPAYPAKVWKKVIARAGVHLPPRQATHTGRIFFVTEQLERGVSIEDVGAAVNHTDPSITLRYRKFRSRGAKRALASAEKILAFDLGDD